MNAAICLAQLDVEVRLLTRVGDDEPGRELVSYIAGNGLSPDDIQVDTIQPTGRVIADVSNPHAVNYDIVAPAAWDYIDSSDYLKKCCGPIRALVYGSLAARHEVSRRSLFDLIGRAELRVFDVNLRAGGFSLDTIERLLELSDWVKLNELELEIIAGWLGLQGDSHSRSHALRERYGLKGVCVTLGESGAFMLGEGKLRHQPAYHVSVVDTIGCGDAFLGAWLAGMLAHAAPADVLRAGCAAGAIAATRSGACAALSNDALQRFIGEAR